MKVKLYNIENLEKFFKIINECQGNIKIISKEGDCLNMKSKLTQLVFAANVFGNPIIKDLEMEIDDPNDAVKILQYMMHG